MRLSEKDVMDLYHNRHERMEVCERSKPKLLVVSYKVEDNFEHMTLKVQANEDLYVREPQIYLEVAMNRIYKVPLSKKQKEKCVERENRGDQMSSMDAFFEIRKQVQHGELEDCIQDISEFDVLYQTTYKKSPHNGKFVSQFSEH